MRDKTYNPVLVLLYFAALLGALWLAVFGTPLPGSERVGPGGGVSGGSQEFSLSPQIGEYAPVDLTSTGTTTIGNHPSEAGILVGVYIGVWASDAAGSPVGATLDVDVVVTVDGSIYTEQIYNTTCPGGGQPCFQVPFQDLNRATTSTSGGSDPGSRLGTDNQYFLNIPYSSALRVDIVVNTAASAGTNLNASMFRLIRGAGQAITERTVTELQAPIGVYTDLYTNAAIDVDIIDQDPESGILHALGILVEGRPPTSTFTLADDPLLECDITITLDGIDTVQPIYDGGCASSERFNLAFQALGTQTDTGAHNCPGKSGTGGGFGAETGTWLQVPYHARYFDSILVNLSCLAQVTTATNAGLTISVLRSTI